MSVKSRLTDVLKHQILHQLPSLLRDIEVRIREGEAELSRLGEERATLADQRQYLLHIARRFLMLMKSATDGSYKDAFFGSAKTAEGYAKRLRAVI